MSSLYFMITIANRAKLPGIVSLYQEKGISVNFIALGHGTAGHDTLSLLGLDNSEKAVCFAVVTKPVWKEAKRGLERNIRIDLPGTGIAFIVPMSSIGGKRELAFLTENFAFEKGDEQTLKGTKHELLVIISNQGHTETVMDAAREAGAAGGTFIHARGTGTERAEHFLGVSLASEKDITFVVTKTEEKNAIMEAIMRKAGPESKAKAIVFSLPVTDTAGLRLIEVDDEDQEEKEN